MIKMRLRMLPNVRKPFYFVHTILSDQGFYLEKWQDRIQFKAIFRDTASNQAYLLSIPAGMGENGTSYLKLNESSFEQEERVPLPVIDAALSKLQEIADYLRQDIRELPDSP
ncbi:MAG: hypothetical protein A2189_03190 [Paenibacillus sp. RIFOXYA1_FULL_44_5]|nr:MAG: hypothetical protein A2189_03190 [Paenibacillus sp. RIFOXYA1_FULL_44_5]